MQKRKGFQVIQQLYRLSKDGRREQFVELLETSKILRDLNNLDAYQSSHLIYSFYKLDIQQNDIWKTLEDLYLRNMSKMNIHDNVMCGWAFLNISKNALIWDHIQNYLKKSTMELLKNQEKASNLGLIAYIMSSKNVVDLEFWLRLEWVYRETQHIQDQRNYALFIYAFTKMNITTQSVWVMFEEYIWKNEFSEFKFKNIMMIIYAYAKNDKGSDKLWLLFQTTVMQFKDFERLDLNFLQWAFGKMKKGNFKFWELMVNKTIVRWSEFYIHDLEMILSAYRETLFEPDFSSEERNELLTKLGQMKIIKINSNRQRYSIAEEIVSVGRAIENLSLENSPLASSVAEIFFAILPDINFLEYKCKLWKLKVFFQQRPEKFSEDIQNKLIQKLHQEFERRAGDQSEMTTKVQNDLLIDLIILGQTADCKNQTYWEQIALTFLKINIEHMSQKDNLDQYSSLGIQIYLNLDGSLQNQEKVQHLKTQLINQLSCRTLIAQSHERGKVSIISTLKAFTYISPNPYIVNFLQYCKETHQIKFEYFNRIFLVLLHKNGYSVPQDTYALMKLDVVALYDTNFKGHLSQEKLQNISEMIDVLIKCFSTMVQNIQIFFQMNVQEILVRLQPFSKETLKIPLYVVEKSINQIDFKKQKLEFVRELTQTKLSGEQDSQYEHPDNLDNNFKNYLAKEH